MNLDENGFVAEPDREWAAQQRALRVVECGWCDDDGYRGSVVCDHVDHSEAAKRGIARVREVMGWDK